MAVFHCGVKTISRSSGGSAVAAAAYRARDKLHDDLTGKTHNYSNHKGLVDCFMVLPKGQDNPKWAEQPELFWNQAEKSETRINSTVAREFLISLPHELTPEQRHELAAELAEKLVSRFGFGVMAAIHEPTKGQDDRNHHVHILASTRTLTAEGFKEKTRELDQKKSGAVDEVRAMTASIINEHMQKAGLSERVDHRSLEAQHDEALNNQDSRKIVELDRKPIPHAFKGKKWEAGKQKQEQVRAENLTTRKNNVQDFLQATADDASSRSQIIKGLKNQADKTEAEISSAIGAYDRLGELLASKGTTNPLQASLQQLDPLEKALFFDLHKEQIRFSPEQLAKLQTLQGNTLQEAEKLTGKQQEITGQLEGHKTAGEQEKTLLQWLANEASNSGIRFEIKPALSVEAQPHQPSTVLPAVAQMLEALKSKSSPDHSFIHTAEHQNIQQAKMQAAAVRSSSTQSVGNNVVARLASAARSVQELLGQLRGCQPQQRAELLSRLRQADQELAAAHRALDEAKGRALETAAREAEQSRSMAHTPSLIMERIHAKDSS